MRKIFIIMAMVSMFWFATPTHATLWDRGGGLIYDDVLDITWLQDANYAKTSGYDADGLMTWDQATAWAANLVYGGYSEWRLPSAYNQDGSGPDGGYVSTSEMGHMYYNNLAGLPGGPFPGPVFTDGYGNTVSFENLPPYYYWSGTEYSYHPGRAWHYTFGDGFQDHCYKGLKRYAWAVRPGDVAAVPEPATMLLLGSGLIGFAGLRKKFKK